MTTWRSLIPILCILACNFYQLHAKVNITTSDCGLSKGCFRPSCNCTQLTCQYLVTFRQDSTNVYFELSGTAQAGDTPYVALGIAIAAKMFDAYTIGCYWNGSEAVVRDGQTPSSPSRGHSFINPPNNGVSGIEADYDKVNHILSSRFTKTRDPGSNTYAKDLRGDVKYHLLSAQAGTTTAQGFTRHASNHRWYTVAELSLGSFSNIC